MKKEKIVITGGLGYVGSELCKLYSGFTRTKDIVVVDTKFMSGAITQLNSWGIRYIQANILDEVRMAEILQDADLVYHLAGITNVAYTNTNTNNELDALIKTTAIVGTNNILRCVPKKCKIIFPSTHVVFEGTPTLTLNLTETDIPCPVLRYATSKYQNEVDIMASGLDYVILRFASVYGRSADSTRVDIVANLFCKNSSQNVPLKLFGGGIQMKTLVSLHDVCNCLKMMGESSIKNEIFHLSNETMSVKDIALLVKKYNPNTRIIETDDKVPNLGYGLSNSKLLATGFRFRDNLDASIQDMVSNWSDKPINTPVEYVISGNNEFIDLRGKIDNYALPEPINLVGYIESKAGTIRANHYHPVQEQKCLLVRGKYISVTKDLLDPDAILETRLVSAGDLSVILPNVAHAMIFLEDSIFLNLVRGEREHHNYGITHTIPYILVDDGFHRELLQHYVRACRVCGGANLAPVISFGLTPPANNLLSSPTENFAKYPLELIRCVDCYNCQLSYVVPADEMFKYYLYTSSTSDILKQHFRTAAHSYIDRFGLDSSSFVIDVGSNDGISLVPFIDKNISVLGVEPAENISALANQNNVPTMCSYFTKIAAEEIVKKLGSANLVLASNVFAHINNIEDMVHAAFAVLKPDGTLIIEVQYLVNTIKDLTFDNIYHEHVNYWSVTALCNLFTRLGYVVYDAEHTSTHGGSIRAYIGRSGRSISPTIYQFIDVEREFCLLNTSTYTAFAGKITDIKTNMRIKLTALLAGQKVVGYGAPAKATLLLNYFGITSDNMAYIVDDNALKHHKFIPGTGIPICSKTQLEIDPPDIVLVLAWNLFDEIVQKNSALVGAGVIFLNIRELFQYK